MTPQPTTEQVRIERAVYGGAGLAHTSSGAVVFVPFVLPGELAEIELPASGSDASLLRVVAQAPERTIPPCPHFGRCGGCQYQHAEYDTQLAIKREILLETMRRADVRDLPEVAVQAAHPWEYRNRSRFRIEQEDGEWRAGYIVRGTNEFLPIVTCPISAPVLVRSVFALLELARKDRETEMWLQRITEAEFFANEGSSRIGMTLYVKGRAQEGKGSFARMCERLQKKLPELYSAGTLAADVATRSKFAPENWRAAGLAYRAAGEAYWISRGGFFQVNRYLTDELIELVCTDRSGTLAWDLYAGVGLFSRVLARSFEQITAVEANPIALADLRAALTRLGPLHRAVQASTLAFLRNAVVQRERPELIVLDPPRAGAGAEVCDLLLRLAAQRMVYVSCDPTTLARDLVLLQRDYRIAAMHLLDLFPQTFHMETVVALKHR